MHRITQGVVRPCALFLAFAIAFSTLATGQTSRGTVTGLVSDSQKAVIPDADVELNNVSTNTVRSSKTNESGLYRFDAVEPGRYSLQVKSQRISIVRGEGIHRRRGSGSDNGCVA